MSTANRAVPGLPSPDSVRATERMLRQKYPELVAVKCSLREIAATREWEYAAIFETEFWVFVKTCG